MKKNSVLLSSDSQLAWWNMEAYERAMRARERRISLAMMALGGLFGLITYGLLMYLDL
jgi:hypothetical protein